MCKLIFYKCDEELVKEITPHIHSHASEENWVASDDLFSVHLRTDDDVLIIAPDTVSWRTLQKFQAQKSHIQSSFIGIRKSGAARRKNGHFRRIFSWPEEKHDLISYLRRNIGERQDFFKLTFDNFSFPALIIEPASERIRPNLAFCQLTNLNGEQISQLAMQTSIDGTTTDRELKKVHHFLRQIRRAVEGNQTEIIYQDKNQREHWFQIQISPLEGKQSQKLLVSLHNIDVWKREQREWQRRWRYQKLIAEVTRLAFQTTSLDDFLHQALDIIGETTQVSRVYVFKNSDDEKFTSNTHEWVNEGIESFKDQLQNVSYENFPYWYRKLSSNRVIYASDIYADLPEELHGILEQQSIKSLLVVPLWLNQRFYGFLGLDECTFNRQWSAEDIELMRSLAHVLELAILNKQIEEENVNILSALQDSERQKAAILRSAPQGIALVRQHKIIYNNPGLERLFGYSTEELKSMMIDDLIGPSETFAPQGSKIPAEGPLPQVHREERTFHRKDGTPIHCLISGVRVDIGSRDTAPAILMIFTDITELRAAQEALRESEAQYATLVERSSDGIILLQDEGVFTFVNERFCEITGYHREELLGKHFSNFVPMDVREELIRRYNLRMQNQPVAEEYEGKILTRDGRIRDVEISAKKIRFRGKDADMIYVRDVTERKKLTEKLQFQATFLKHAGVLAFATDLNGNFIYANPLACKAFGIPLEDIKHHSILNHIHIHKGYDWNSLVQHVKDAQSIDIEVGIKCPSGHLTPALLTLVGLVNEHGELYTITGIGTDISDLKKQEQILIKNNQELLAFNTLAQVLTSSVDLVKILSNCAKATSEIAGVEKSAVYLFDDHAKMFHLTASHGLERGICDRIGTHKVKGQTELQRILAQKVTLRRRGFYSPPQWQFLRSNDITAVIAIPVISKGKLIGLFHLFVGRTNFVNGDTLQLLEKLQPQLAGILENALLHFEVEQRARRMTALTRAIIATNHLQKLDSLLPEFARILVDELGFKHGWIALKDEREQSLRCVAAHGPNLPDEIREMNLPLDQKLTCPPLKCLEEQKPQTFFEAGHYPVTRYLPVFSKLNVKSVFFVPIPGRNDPIGVIGVTADSRFPFQKDDITALSYLAEQLHTAIDNTRLYHKIQDNYKKITQLQEISRQMASTLKLHEVLRFACRSIVEILGYHAAWIGLFLNGNKTIEPVAQFHLGKPIFKALKQQIRQDQNNLKPLQAILESKKTIVFPDFHSEQDVPEWMARMREQGFRSCAGFPIMFENEVQGILAIYSKKKHAFSDHDLSIIETFVSQTGVTINNARLFDEVQKNIREIESKNRELEAFVYTVSHDLKAPVISMNGFSHILLDVHGAKLSKEERFYLQRIRDNVVLMEQLINDLLDLSRVGRVVGKRQIFSARKVLEEIISSFYLQLQEKHIKIILPQNLPQISGDRGRITQVFKNLVHNAIKFTPADRGEKIEILYKQTKTEHVFGVRDHGKGLDPKYQEKIFDLFYRLSNEEQNGTGIGLTIAKRIIEHHGGKIWVRSKPEHGSTFYFTLPK